MASESKESASGPDAILTRPLRLGKHAVHCVAGTPFAAEATEWTSVTDLEDAGVRLMALDVWRHAQCTRTYLLRAYILLVHTMADARATGDDAAIATTARLMPTLAARLTSGVLEKMRVPHVTRIVFRVSTAPRMADGDAGTDTRDEKSVMHAVTLSPSPPTHAPAVLHGDDAATTQWVAVPPSRLVALDVPPDAALQLGCSDGSDAAWAAVASVPHAIANDMPDDDAGAYVTPRALAGALQAHVGWAVTDIVPMDPRAAVVLAGIPSFLSAGMERGGGGNAGGEDNTASVVPATIDPALRYHPAFSSVAVGAVVRESIMDPATCDAVVAGLTRAGTPAWTATQDLVQEGLARIFASPPHEAAAGKRADVPTPDGAA